MHTLSGFHIIFHGYYYNEVLCGCVNFTLVFKKLRKIVRKEKLKIIYRIGLLNWLIVDITLELMKISNIVQYCLSVV